MSNKCYLEVYSKHNELSNQKEVEYWNKYIELVEPILSEITNPANGLISRDKVNELLPEFKNERYPLRYYSKDGDDYFVYNNQLCFKYFVPDTFLMPFKKGQENIYYNSDYDPINDQFSGCNFSYTTTIRDGLAVMNKRVQILEDSDFKTGCNEVLEFLKGMPLDSILTLKSADIYIEESPECMLEEISRIEKMFARMDSK